MKTGKVLPVLLAGILTAGVFALPPQTKSARASVAPAYAEGVDSSEIVLLSGETQVEVEKEKLTFHAEKLPKPYMGEKCEGTVRAEYTLYNPSDRDETLRLALPLGSTNNYYYEYGGRNRAESEYAVTLNGESVETKLRHSYLFDYEAPAAENLTGSVEALQGDTPLYGYSFTAAMPEGDKNRTLCAEVYYDRQSTLLLASDVRNVYSENGNETITFWLDESVETFTLYFAGAEGTLLSTRIESTDGEVKPENAEITTSKLPVSTFAEFAGKSPYKEVSDGDWLRICAVSAVNRQYDYKPPYELLYRFLEYEITVPAGGRVTHAVQTPLIPSVRSSRCFYSYDFSAARFWAAFRSLEVEIYAESAPNESSLNLASGNGVYTHERSNLPMSGLRFSLGEYDESYFSDGGLNDLEVALIMLAVIIAVAAAVVFVMIRVRRKRMNALQRRAEQEANQTHSEENEKKGE